MINILLVSSLSKIVLTSPFRQSLLGLKLAEVLLAIELEFILLLLLLKFVFDIIPYLINFFGFFFYSSSIKSLMNSSISSIDKEDT